MPAHVVRADGEHAQHRVSLGAGIPIPLQAYGSDASLDETGVDLAFLLYVRGSYSAIAFRALPRLVLGARGSFSTVTVTDGDLSLWGFLGVVGPHAGVRISPELMPGSTLIIAAGPALARSGFRIDENLKREFWCGAVFAFAQLSLPLAGALAFTFESALEHALPAPEDQTFFNQRLGSTTLLTLAIGVELAF